MFLFDLLRNDASRFPDKAAAIFPAERITFAELDRQSDRVAAALHARGIGPGDRVAILCDNDLAPLVYFWGILKSGAQSVDMPTLAGRSVMQGVIDEAGPKAIVIDPKQLAKHGGEGGLNLPQLVLSFGDAETNPPEGRTVLGLSSMLADTAAPVPTPSITPDDVAMIVYTSGTTGRPKGATHTRSSLDAVIRQGVAAHDFTSADRGLEFLPLFHVGGLNIQTLPILSVGGTVLLHRGFDPDAVFDAFENDGPTVSIIVPTPMQVLIGHPRWTELDAGALRGVMTGSSIVPADLLDAFNTAGLRAGQVYGSTETGPTSVVLRFEDADRVGSCGRAIGTAEMRVVDEHGLPASVGEVQIRGPHLFAGYWNDAEATAAAFDGEWYRTGDVGEVDPDGWLTILDRLGDMLITGGENVYPAEVEPVLASAPGVAELTVIGLPDERWGQTPVAVVVAADGQEPTIESMREHGGARLARYKLPTRLELVEALPRTALGKVRKNELVARFSR